MEFVCHSLLNSITFYVGIQFGRLLHCWAVPLIVFFCTLYCQRWFRCKTLKSTKSFSRLYNWNQQKKKRKRRENVRSQMIWVLWILSSWLLLDLLKIHIDITIGNCFIVKGNIIATKRGCVAINKKINLLNEHRKHSKLLLCIKEPFWSLRMGENDYAIGYKNSIVRCILLHFIDFFYRAFT